MAVRYFGLTKEEYNKLTPQEESKLTWKKIEERQNDLESRWTAQWKSHYETLTNDLTDRELRRLKIDRPYYDVYIGSRGDYDFRISYFCGEGGETGHREPKTDPDAEHFFSPSWMSDESRSEKSDNDCSDEPGGISIKESADNCSEESEDSRSEEEEADICSGKEAGNCHDEAIDNAYDPDDVYQSDDDSTISTVSSNLSSSSSGSINSRLPPERNTFKLHTLSTSYMCSVPAPRKLAVELEEDNGYCFIFPSDSENEVSSTTAVNDSSSEARDAGVSGGSIDLDLARQSRFVAKRSLYFERFFEFGYLKRRPKDRHDLEYWSTPFYVVKVLAPPERIGLWIIADVPWGFMRDEDGVFDEDRCEELTDEFDYWRQHRHWELSGSTERFAYARIKDDQPEGVFDLEFIGKSMFVIS
ncbi:MAG: hypothetical protein M1821_008992 [Bathelium mastoideum]|nr:MAG: hypothetical protein M1821_008992 [Bathelium mastoideum]KAI9684305.1 MAG: hypothetical protein M1822_005778 [Bathelium mastoideum]